MGPLAIVVHALSAAIIFVFASDMGLPLTALDCLLLIPPIMLLTTIPISISGWGPDWSATNANRGDRRRCRRRTRRCRRHP